jgi:hypothetical protein
MVRTDDVPCATGRYHVLAPPGPTAREASIERRDAMGYLISNLFDTVVGQLEVFIAEVTVGWLFSGPTDCCNTLTSGDLLQ